MKAIGWLFVISCFVMSLSLFYFLGGLNQKLKQSMIWTEYDMDCLRNYADRFCEGKLNSFDTREFSCVIRDYPRQNYKEIKGYYFTPEELNACKSE